MKRFVLVSDTHNHRPSLPEGDILLHAGDFTMNGSMKETINAMEWVGVQASKFEHVVITGGNHDFFMWHLSQEMGTQAVRDFVFKHAGPNVMYLENELWATELEGKTFSVYGSPVQPVFGEMAWNVERGPAIKAVWDNIPTWGVDVLMTHGPAYHLLDWVGKDRVGCVDLKEALDRVQPKLHVFGHIHAAYGKARSFDYYGRTTECYNAALCGEAQRIIKTAPDGTEYTVGFYPLAHPPWVLDYDGEKFVEAQP